jgi:hypothetical protein
LGHVVHIDEQKSGAPAVFRDEVSGFRLLLGKDTLNGAEAIFGGGIPGIDRYGDFKEKTHR